MDRYEKFFLWLLPNLLLSPVSAYTPEQISGDRVSSCDPVITEDREESEVSFLYLLQSHGDAHEARRPALDCSKVALGAGRTHSCLQTPPLLSLFRLWRSSLGGVRY